MSFTWTNKLALLHYRIDTFPARCICFGWVHLHLLQLMSRPPKGISPLPPSAFRASGSSTDSHTSPERLTCSVVVIGRDLWPHFAKLLRLNISLRETAAGWSHKSVRRLDHPKHPQSVSQPAFHNRYRDGWHSVNLPIISTRLLFGSRLEKVVVAGVISHPLICFFPSTATHWCNSFLVFLSLFNLADKLNYTFTTFHISHFWLLIGAAARVAPVLHQPSEMGERNSKLCVLSCRLVWVESFIIPLCIIHGGFFYFCTQ